MRNQIFSTSGFKILPSVKKLGMRIYHDCESLSSQTLDKRFDLTLFKDSTYHLLCCKATPKNRFFVNNRISRFIYDYLDKSEVMKIGTGDHITGCDTVKTLADMTVRKLAKKLAMAAKLNNKI